MFLDRSTTIGSICVIAFVLSTGVRDVYFGGVFQSISVFAVLLIAFSMASAIGIALALLRRNGGLSIVWSSPGDAFMVNVTTALAWTCYFLAIQRIEPSIAATLFSGMAPVTVIAFNAIGVSIAAPVASAPLQKCIQIGMLGVLAALVAIVALGYSGVGSVGGVGAVGSAVLAMAAGSLITVSLMYCKKLNERGASPEAILGARFFGLIVLAALVIVTGNAGDSLPDFRSALGLAPLAVLLIVAPVYLQQIGISRIGPLNAKIIATLGPVLVFLMQQFDARIAWSTPTLVAICAYSALALMSNLVQQRSPPVLKKIRRPHANIIGVPARSLSKTSGRRPRQSIPAPM